MNIKSLLTTASIVCVALAANAFPTVTVSPADGSTLNSKYLLGSFNLKGDNLDIVEGYTAVLSGGEDFDEINSFRFEKFLGENMINFDTSLVGSNGEWTLTIPAGSLKSGDEVNSEPIEFHYTLNDPDLNVTPYPQITLLSVNPVEGTVIPVWGGDLFTKVEFKTSDDAAVNYIEWTLYDVTDGANSYVRSGNDNRFDPNRYGGDESDIWEDGLFIAVAGNERLLKGHTYRLDVRFCGIGYDIATNQFPTPTQIQNSTELQTSVTYQGGSDLPEYSPYEIVSVSPDPATYEIDNIDLRTFTVTYSGPVKPYKFEYAYATGSMASAGTYQAVDPNEDGYADKWEFTFSESVLSDAVGQMYVTIAAKDADGLDVKGNSDGIYDNILYGMAWNCNLGATKLVSVEPLNGEEVDELSRIVIGNEKNIMMAYSYYTSEKPTIVTRTGSVIRTLEEPTYSSDETQAIWEFDPITEAGEYILMIPKSYFNIGEQFDSTTANATNFTYIVKDNGQAVVGELLPSEVTPADNATETELTNFVVKFSDVAFTTPDENGELRSAEAYLYRVVEEGDDVLIEKLYGVENDMWNPTVYTFTLSDKVDEKGTYRFFIPAQMFCDGAYDESMGESGNVSPELEYFYIVNNMNGVADIFAADGTVTVYNLNGVKLLENAPVEEIKSLPAGLYIINGKKVVIK